MLTDPTVDALAGEAADLMNMAEVGRRAMHANLLILWSRSGRYLSTSLISPTDAPTDSVDMEVGEGVAGAAAESGIALVLRDLQDRAELSRKGIQYRHPRLVQEMGLHSAIYLPIRLPRSAGVVAVYSTTIGRYTSGHLAALSIVAERLMLRANMATVDERVGRLSRVGYVLNEHIHDIRQSAQTAAMNAEAIRDDDGLPSSLRPAATAVVRQLHALARHANRSLDAVVRDAPKKRLVPISRPVLEALSLIDTEAAENRISVGESIDHEVVALVVEDDIARAVLNLLRNSIRGLKSVTHRKKSIHVEVGRTPSVAYIDVVDNGAGISSHHVPRIFEFGTSFSGGSGIGLSQVEAVVVFANGDIEVESDPGRSTRFSIRLPRPLASERAPG